MDSGDILEMEITLVALKHADKALLEDRRWLVISATFLLPRKGKKRYKLPKY